MYFKNNHDKFNATTLWAFSKEMKPKDDYKLSNEIGRKATKSDEMESTPSN